MPSRADRLYDPQWWRLQQLLGARIPLTDSEQRDRESLENHYTLRDYLKMKTDEKSEAALAARATRIQQLMARDTIDQREVNELLRLANLGGKIPAADFLDENGASWKVSTIKDWMLSDECLHVRSAGLAEPIEGLRTADRGSLAPKSYSREDGTFVGVVNTDTPVAMLDPFSGSVIREALLSSGMQVPAQFPLLRDHAKKIGDLIGQGSGSRVEGESVVVNFRLAPTPGAREVGDLIEQGLLSGLSVGYSYSRSDFLDVNPGETRTIAGRAFRNDSDAILRVVFKSRLHEVSCVVFPANSEARIRAGGTSNMVTPAIHSRQSVTGIASRGEALSALVLACGGDPLQRASYSTTRGGFLFEARSAQLEQDAERGYHLARKRDWELLAEVARAVGLPIRSRESTCLDELFSLCANEQNQRHLPYDGRRSFSTGDLSAIYADAVASVVLTAMPEDSTSGWCDEREVDSFKEHNLLKLSELHLQRRPRGAKADSAKISDSKEGVTVSDYASWFQIDDQDFLDGSAGELLRTVPTQMAKAAGSLRADLVYSCLLRNADLEDGVALFHADHANLNASAGLADSPLAAAAAGISKQTDENGRPLDLRARYLIVPPALERTAAKLCREVFIDDGQSTPAPIVRSDARLEVGLNDPLTPATALSGSATTWFMSTKGEYGLTVLTLRGHEKRPQIRSSFLDQQSGLFGLCFDVRYVIGVAAAAHQGLSKNTA